MNFTTIKEAIRVAVRDAAGGLVLDPNVVFADSAAAGTWRVSPRVDIRWLGVRTLGTDYEVQRETGSGEDVNVDAFVAGQRLLSLSIKIEDDAVTSLALASKIQTRLGFASIAAALRNANLAIANVSQVTQANYRANDRIIDASVISVQIAAPEIEGDETAFANYGAIEHVIATGLLKRTSMDTVVYPLVPFVIDLINFSSYELVAPGHAFALGHELRFFENVTPLPSALAEGVRYWIVYVTEDTFGVALTPNGAAISVSFGDDGAGGNAQRRSIQEPVVVIDRA